MKIAITGATGLIGRALVPGLLAAGDQVAALTRDPERGRTALGDRVELHQWRDPLHEPPPAAALSGAQAVIHLLGEPVAQRWSAEAKQRIRDSRLLSTEQLIDGLSQLPEGSRPAVLVSGSATGFYGASDARPLEERDPPGTDFLAEVVVAWEQRAGAARELGMRVVTPRTGVVLAAGGGALEKMLPPFRWGVGGPVAGGRQYVPWIHLADVCGALRHCVDVDALEGPVNLTAPHPVTNAELSKVLGRVLHRPAVLPVPALAVRLLYGEMATIVTTGQHVVPARLQDSGYRFAFGELEPALRDALGR